MRILLINHYAGSIEMGMEFRPYYLGKEWIKLGHSVDIIAGDYSHLRKDNPNVNKDFETSEIDGIRYHWLKTGEYTGNGIKRALTMFRFVSKLWLNAKKIVKDIKPDVVIASSTYPIDTFAAQRIAKFAHAKLIHEVHDMWPATLIEVGGMSKMNPFVLLMQIGENSAYKKSDYVVSLLPNSKEYMIEHGLNPEKFHHIANGVVLEDWNNPKALPAEHQETLKKYREQDKFIVGYFGGHALSNALDTLVDAAISMADNSHVQIVMVGDGVEKERLKKRARRIENICFLPSIPKLCIPNLLKEFDCVYVGAKDSSLYRFGIAMNKIYDSMMGGKPLIYGVNASNNYVERYKCGVEFKPDNPETVVQAIMKIMQLSEEERSTLGLNGKKAVIENYNYQVLAYKFIQVMQL